LKKRVKELENGLKKKKEGTEKEEKEDGKGRSDGGLETRIIKIEKNIEARERKERRKRNLVIKGVQKMKGDWRWGVEKILKDIGVEIRCEEMKRLSIGNEERGDMVWVKFGSEENKRIVWEKKKSLKRSKIWIDEDWTWREREVRRKLGRLAVQERGKGRRVWGGRE